MTSIKLGKSSSYTDQYDASLLAPIARGEARASLLVADFKGRDEWTSFELSWLNVHGLPRVALAVFRFDSDSTYIIESKSFKYYLNSYNQTKFSGAESVKERLVSDLSAACDGQVSVTLFAPNEEFEMTQCPPGYCVDDIPVDIDIYQPDKQLLQFNEKSVQNDQLYSHLLKSNCPVTDQPDWATVWIQYSGSKLVEQSFLKYVVSFRQYQGFHESCVERIFSDLWGTGNVTSLCVFARYTRRGGLDINPIRYSSDFPADFLPFGRLVRQ